MIHQCRFRGRSEQVSQVLIKHALDYVKLVIDSWAQASVGAPSDAMSAR